jgi:hypothetical protein
MCWSSSAKVRLAFGAPRVQTSPARFKPTLMPLAQGRCTSPAMTFAMPFSGAAPALQARDVRKSRARAAYAVLGAALLAFPLVPAGHVIPGSAKARFAIPSLTPAAFTELQPESRGGDLSSAGEFALSPAPPFVASYSDPASALRAETCLTEAIYYEGALEPDNGQRAIAQVVLNRVRHPAYPDNVCGVVFEGQARSTGCQFTFTCDGSRARAPVPSLWARAHRIAKAALGGAVAPEVGLSTHYHADYVTPYWSASLDATGQIGRHKFYRWRGNNGQPAAFVMRYSGREPLIAAYTPPPAGSRQDDRQSATLPTATLAMPGGGETSTSAPALALAQPAAGPFKARPLRLDNQNASAP